VHAVYKEKFLSENSFVCRQKRWSLSFWS